MDVNPNSTGNWITYGPGMPNTGSYAWTVLNLPPRTQVVMRIRSLGLPTVSDVSDAPFTVLVPTLTLTSPNGGETWQIGETACHHLDFPKFDTARWHINWYATIPTKGWPKIRRLLSRFALAVLTGPSPAR